MSDQDQYDVTDVPELRAFVEYAGPAALIQRCCGLHVHVSVADEAACMAALECALPWLPLVLALSANSPYAAGAPSGKLERYARRRPVSSAVFFTKNRLGNPGAMRFSLTRSLLSPPRALTLVRRADSTSSSARCSSRSATR